MKDNKKSEETLLEFKKSLFYGERNNLFFKFLTSHIISAAILFFFGITLIIN